jgi:replication factor A1
MANLRVGAAGIPMLQEELAPHVDDITRALQGKVEQEQVQQELQRYLEYGVPLAQAKRDIVRNYGGRPGMASVAKKLRDVGSQDANVDFVARVVTVNPKEVTARGEKRTIHYGLLGDETRVLPYTAWRDFQLQKGMTVAVRSAYITEWRGEPQVNLGERAQVSVAEQELAAAELGPRAAQEKKVRELRGGLPAVSLSVRILKVQAREVTVEGKPRALWSGEAADETGKVRFTAWRDLHLQEDAVVRVQNAYTRSWRGMPDLNLGDSTHVEVLPSDALPPRSQLQAAQPMGIGELEDLGGGADVLLDGTVLEVKKGSGLIFRCPDCKRVLQKGECRLHSKVKGTPDLRVKAVLDDGTGALTIFLPREIVEQLLGKGMEECQAMAKEAMTPDVVEEELVKLLVARPLRVAGNATSDDFGLMLIASRADVVRPESVKQDAEKLLADLQEEGA